MKRTPYDIISADSHMVVEPHLSTSIGLKRRAPSYDTLEDARKALWPPTFCKLLDVLLSHPRWRRKHQLLSAAIHYTAACATDDRRWWGPRCTPDSLFLWTFLEAMKSKNPDESPIDVHARALRKTRQDPDRPWWSRLFAAIESAMLDSRRAVINACLGLREPDDEPIIVRESDLIDLAFPTTVANRPDTPLTNNGTLTVGVIRQTMHKQWRNAMRAKRRRESNSSPLSPVGNTVRRRAQPGRAI